MSADKATRYSLEVDANGDPSEKGLQVATIALLLEMAKVNNQIEKTEIDSLVRSVSFAFDILDEQTGELLEIATFMLKTPGNLDKFVELIATRFNLDQKQRVMGMVWKVISADGVADKYETSFAAHLRTRLGLSLEQAVRARQLAESGEFDPADFELEVYSDGELGEDNEEH
jgi:uncharacterized tellurite resistance protein B-like protein